MTDKHSTSYKAGNQWARMSVPSRIGAALGAIFFIVGLGVLAMFWASRAVQSSSVRYTATTPEAKPARTPEQVKADREINIVLAGARWLKESMKKPESFELLSATMIEGKVICYEYRARNSFNDRRTERYVISDNVSSSKPKDWNRLCAGKSGTDYTHARSVL
ncbi:hypothetical protein J2W30_003670 [Variovorax boronicumulans]|uniref:hypothetical protein n=1 Tax=Variovorax boronicumulans TaxID=436515 RepID=UPI00278B5FE8|nr:hypothetical protein [Variovorax boronicumulans]MDQ0035897.1 hypothetical protein [Variovorax boronicumulans]